MTETHTKDRRGQAVGEEESCLSAVELSRKFFASFSLGSELFGYRTRYRILSAGCKSNCLLFLSASLFLLSKHGTPASPSNTQMTERPENQDLVVAREHCQLTFQEKARVQSFMKHLLIWVSWHYSQTLKPLNRPNKAQLWARFGPGANNFQPLL